MENNPNDQLMCKLYPNEGKPLKTKLARDFPNLTRRERRAMLHRGKLVLRGSKLEVK
jgi:hypothetical protein